MGVNHKCDSILGGGCPCRVLRCASLHSNAGVWLAHPAACRCICYHIGMDKAKSPGKNAGEGGPSMTAHLRERGNVLPSRQQKKTRHRR